MSLNVLITAGSRRVPLVRAFQRAVAHHRGGNVIVTDVNPLSPAVHAANRAFRVPLSAAPDYLDAILEICSGERVSLVVPTIDDELVLFGRAAARFRAHGVRVAVSPAATSALCEDKYASCRYLNAQGIAAAASWLPNELPAAASFPLFIKPRRGRGGLGAYAVRSARELDFFAGYVPDAVVQAYLDGPEFTIDMLCDFSGQPLSIVPRRRDVIRAGVTDRGRTVNDPALIRVAEACAKTLAFAGAVNIQCRLVDGQPIIFEINPRFSGGIPLTIQAGADFPRMLVDLAAGVRVPASIGRFRDNLWMASYETSVFVDGSRVSLSEYHPSLIEDVA
ncbi:MAG: ATP-grasp domain-containing protein [Acidobacteria bacterium]|nr:ATP-grasp domain-containing protein [Acidobacteriota bacterium]